MQGTRLTVAAVACATLAWGPCASAQSVARPTIHNVTIDEGSGVLTITGVGFGRDPVVTVDGQPVVVLQGGSDTQLVVLAPAALLITPGTYRLTVQDPVTRAGDAFEVASPTGSPRAADADATRGSLSSDTIAPGEPRGTVAPANGLPEPVRGGLTPHLIENGANTALGVDALAHNTTGILNTAIGTSALYSNTTGLYNTASGREALYSNTTGKLNTASGVYALSHNSTGDYNTASGVWALSFNTTGTLNTASGYFALYSNTTGTLNTASGASALQSNTTGYQNTTSGVYSLFHNTTGTLNTASGVSALQSNTTGTLNTASGVAALYANTTGDYNTANGVNALHDNTTGVLNTASGVSALYSNTTGFQNTASGAGALYANTTGYFNTASGYGALHDNTGRRNTAFGYDAGSFATTGIFNVFLGSDVVGLATDTNTMRLGLPYNAVYETGQNQTFIAGIRGTTVTGGEMVLIDESGKLGSGTVAPGPNTVGSAQVIDDALTASDLAPGAVGTSELGTESVTAAKVAFNYAASTSKGGAASDVACVGCVAASEVSFSFASLGANTFTGTQRIGSGHLDLAPSTATAGNLTKNGVPFLHNFGVQNTFLGEGAGNLTMTGFNNTAGGTYALSSNTTGFDNTAIGDRALTSDTTGKFNTAVGGFALVANTTGSRNVALGYNAGLSATAGSYNLFLGAGVFGTDADTNTIRIGLPGVQNQNFIAGIRGITTGLANAIPVVIDSAGQLGTVSSSRRFKEDIQDMADASAGILRLRPVTFRYRQAFAGGAKPRQYGLIAEEVAEVYPDLVVLGADGQVETVQYDKVNAMLLNELQKQHRELDTQAEQIRALTAQLTALAARVEAGGRRD